MDYNEPIKKEDEKKNWLSYILEKSEGVYKIFRTTTILSSMCYIIYKYICLKEVENFYGIPYFYFLDMDIIQDSIYYILTVALLVYGIISVFISIGIEKTEESLENLKEKLIIINFPNIFAMLLFIYMLLKYKVNSLNPLLIFIYVIMSIILFFLYFIPYIVKEISCFLKTIKQIFKENKKIFKLIFNEIVKKIKVFFQDKTLIKIKRILQFFFMIINVIIIMCIILSNSEKNKYEEKKDYEIIVKDDKIDTKASIKNIQVIVGYYNNCAIVMTANENKGNLVIAPKNYKLIPIDNLKIENKHFNNVECK